MMSSGARALVLGRLTLFDGFLGRRLVSQPRFGRGEESRKLSVLATCGRPSCVLLYYTDRFSGDPEESLEIGSCMAQSPARASYVLSGGS